jgi:hypothetical protein
MVLIQRVLRAALALPLAVLANPEAVPGAYIVEFDDSAHVVRSSESTDIILDGPKG